ncbi:hypothetical protein [Beggiatoa leptomitoformis]|uniref:Nucleotidyltransferase n=1 Tax=Beggiatoa leptomitoformis TaxID=288004 RepID=A0A2N9YDC3_9GAMM|nr:hypothetical protein [Beggiatoa leptomitoformis]ALG69100.1 hypothetical protein AL038_17180 [Beggiatoa leptomitoformis]AUI68487.1 hypothetical protein BLE401_07055 [Beggiatoa leptomitoformis]
MKNATDSQFRQRIAQASARLMVQEGIDDYHLAKCKAATQLGVPNTRNLPSNSEIQEEIVIYQRLFKSDTQPLLVHTMRESALHAMRMLQVFSPRLVGSVLLGTATPHSEINLHLFAYSPEEVALFLMNKGIPYELTERKFRLPARESNKTVNYPCYYFVAGEHNIALTVFNIDDVRWSPPSATDGKPMKRADLSAVEKLLQTV